MAELKATCAITGKEFIVSEQEQELRSKFGLKNILPKLSPLERMRAMLTHRILHGFWKNKSMISGESVLAMYSPQGSFPVITDDEYRSDDFDAIKYGREIDWGRSLLEQWRELWEVVPRPHHSKVNCENCEFSNNIGYSQNCYYVFGANDCDGVYNSDMVWGGRDCVDCFQILNGAELCHNCVYCRDGCYGCGYCIFCYACTDCLGCVDCQSCQNCLLCWGLRHQKFCYKNEQLSEEEYAAKLAEYKSDWSRLQKEYDQVQADHQYDTNLNIENSSGVYLRNTKDCYWCYGSFDSENLCNCLGSSPSKDTLDCVHGIQQELSMSCCVCGLNTYNLLGCAYCYMGARDLIHCMECCNEVKECLLCISLNKRQHHCVLNKPYSKEEYEELKPRLISKMKGEGWYGEGLPIGWSNPYNQTTAQDLLPLTREEAEGRGLKWAEEEDLVSVEGAEVAGDETVAVEDVEKLNGKILKCERTGRPFKLIAAELNLYAKHGLPLPKLHPDERYRDRVKQTIPLESIFE